jgi:hypothetical protein
MLFADLESMVGVLEQEVLMVEGRYKHSLMHEGSTVTVRRTCKIRRVRGDCPWSLCAS